MKTRCYPKYSYIIIIVSSIFMFLVMIAPIFSKTNDETNAKVFCSSFGFICCVSLIICAIHEMQYYYIDGNYIVVESAFGTIMKLDAFNVWISVETLPTFFIHSRPVVYMKWICIYDNSLQNNYSSRFEMGCSNNKKFKRIQIIYNDKNKKAIELWAQKFDLGE